jgi:2-methylcitrate dehydratase PrpD
MGATTAVAEFIVNTSAQDFPADAVEKSKKVIADTYAVLLAGVSSEVAEPMMRYVDLERGSGGAPILGTGVTVSAETAALVSGAYGHALDYDDVLSMMPAHPSVVILAALLADLAIGDSGAPVSGRQMLDAYIIGVEVGGKIGLGMTNEHYKRGFHATGTLALFSAVAALAKINQLDTPTTEQAFGIAASMSSGLRRNFGTMTKPLHSGIAARSALTAVRLAKCGFTAARDILEAEAGFFSTYGVADSDPEVTVRGLGSPFVVSDPGIAIKKFPCCYATHRAMDGVLTLRERLGFDASSIKKVICKMPPGGMSVLIYPRPVTGLEGKFSLPYCIAAAVLDGKFSLASFSDEAVRRSDIALLYEKIDAAEHDSARGDNPHFEKLSSGSRGFVQVEVKLRDGRTDAIRIDKAPGSPSRELTWDDMRAKFMDCAKQAPRIAETDAVAAFNAIRTLETLPDIRSISAKLR